MQIIATYVIKSPIGRTIVNPQRYLWKVEQVLLQSLLNYIES